MKRIALILAALLVALPAHAQQKKIGGPIGAGLDKIQNDINQRNAGQIASGNAVALTGDPIADLHAAIKAAGAKLIIHLKLTYALASAPVTNADGSSSDQIDGISAPCAKALVPIFDLVINGPKAAAVAATDPMALTADEKTQSIATDFIEGPIVKIEKLRILRISFSSSALTIACGPLVQDEVKNGQNIAGKITSLITGAGIAGLGL